jgi:hypothetical protein
MSPVLFIKSFTSSRTSKRRTPNVHDQGSGDLSLTILPGLTVTKLTLDADRDVPLTTVIRVAALRTKVMRCYNAVFPQT